MAINTRPIQFLDYLPEAFRNQEATLHLTVVSVSGTTVQVEPFNRGAVGFPNGTPICVEGKPLTVQLTTAIPANQTGLTQLQVEDTTGLVVGNKLRILGFFDHQKDIPHLTVVSISGTSVEVEPFATGAMEFPAGTLLLIERKLAEAIPANQRGLTQLQVDAADLEAGDQLRIVSFFSRFLEAFETLFENLEAQIAGLQDNSSGGIPDLFNPNTTPPPQLTNRPPAQADLDYLSYLASWIGLPLRTDLVPREGESEAAYAERRLDWNRKFFRSAIDLYPQRGTLRGLKDLLTAWLQGEVEERSLILTDLTRSYTDVDTIFRLAPDGETGDDYARVGVTTVLGEGPPFFFLVDLTVDPSRPELRHPDGLATFQRAARFLLDREKPAHTYYQLRVRSHTMRLAPSGVTDLTAARVGETTLLWDEPWVFNSEG